MERSGLASDEVRRRLDSLCCGCLIDDQSDCAMRNALACFLAAALLLYTSAVDAAVFRSPNDKHLTSKSFKKSVHGSDKLTVAAFVAPW